MCQLQLLFNKKDDGDADENENENANENGDDDADGIIRTTIWRHKDSDNKEMHIKCHGCQSILVCNL